MRRRESNRSIFSGGTDGATDEIWKAGLRLDQQMRDEKRWADTQKAIDRRFPR